MPRRSEQLAERAVLDVTEAVVGHQPLGDDPVRGEEGERALDKAGHGRRPLVVVELDVGESRVVVDDRVRVVVADPRLGAHPAARALRAVAGDAVAGPQEAGVAGDVHVQQVAGAGPLVAVGRLLGRLAAAARSRARFSTFQTVECAKPVAPATKRGPQPVWRRQAQIARSSSGASRRGERCGRLERSNRHDSVRRASSPAVQPAVPPAVRRRRRDAEGGRRRLQRHPFLDRPHQAKRPASPSLALACRYIRALLRA